MCWSILAIAGCGGNDGRVEVRGAVAVDGVPLESGSIALVPLSGAGVSAGAPVTSGRYAIPAAQGPRPGSYRVEIKGTRKTGKQIVDDMRQPPDNLVDEIEQFVPPQFNTQSQLMVEIQPGANDQVNFSLSLGAGK